MLVNDYQDEGIIRRPIFIFNRNHERGASFIAHSFDINYKKLKMDEKKIIQFVYITEWNKRLNDSLHAWNNRKIMFFWIQWPFTYNSNISW